MALALQVDDTVFLQASDTVLARAEPWKVIKGLKLQKMLLILTCMTKNGPVPWLWQDLWLFNWGAGVEITAAASKMPNGCKGTELLFLANRIKK